MEIRIAQPNDSQPLEDFLVANIGERIRQSAQEHIHCMLFNQYRKPTFIIATQNNQIVGAVAYSKEIFTSGTYGIGWVNVSITHRNQGIATQLIQTCFQEIMAIENQTVSIILGTYPEKTKLYENLGFKKGMQDHHGGWYMLKTLEP